MRQVIAAVDHLAAADRHDGIQLLRHQKAFLEDGLDIVRGRRAFIGHPDLGGSQRNFDDGVEHRFQSFAVEERDFAEALPSKVLAKLVHGVGFDAKQGWDEDFHEFP